jgi:hypothetical protein
MTGWKPIPLSSSLLVAGQFLVDVCRGCGFLSLRDPTTRWSGHPRLFAFSVNRTRHWLACLPRNGASMARGAWLIA